MNDEIRSGIALDIDDTLSDTKRHFIHLLQQRYGNPENLTVEQIIEKYHIVPNIDYYQTEEAKSWLLAQGSLNEAQENIIVADGAKDIVKKINEVLPVRMYITSRPSIVVDGTATWLNKHGFPKAELITRPMSKLKIDGNAWKAEILKKRYPAIVGIVDDNPEIIAALGPDYPGTIYLFGDQMKDYTGSNVRVCKTWNDVLSAITADNKPLS